jgi:hypothetical protein
VYEFRRPWWSILPAWKSFLLAAVMLALQSVKVATQDYRRGKYDTQT